MRSATSLRMVASPRAEPSACRLFLTVRAANPAVALPSTKRARARAAHTVAVSSAESTWPITICIRAPRLADMIGVRHRTCNRGRQATVRIAAARGGSLEPFKTTTLLDGFGSKLYVSAAAPKWPCGIRVASVGDGYWAASPGRRQGLDRRQDST